MRILCIDPDPDSPRYYCVPESHEDPDTTLYLAGLFLQRCRAAGSIRVGGGLSYEGVEVIQFSPSRMPDLEEKWTLFVKALNDQGISVNGDLNR